MESSVNLYRSEFVRLAIKHLPHDLSSLLGEEYAFLDAAGGEAAYWCEELDLNTTVELYQANVLACEDGYCFSLPIPEKGELGYAELWSICLKYEKKLFLDEEDFGCLFQSCNEDDPRYAEVLEKVFKRVYKSPSTILSVIANPRIRSTELLLRLLANCKEDFNGWSSACLIALKNRQSGIDDYEISMLWHLIYRFCQDKALEEI